MNTYFEKCIQLALASFNFVALCIAKQEVREHFLWAFDI